MTDIFKNYKYIFSAVCVLLVLINSNALSNPNALTCEYLTNPIGVDSPHPRLSWVMNDNRQGATQTAYRILVSKDSLSVINKTGKVWDSGKINGSINRISYRGSSLVPFTKYYWTVLLWDQDGKMLLPSRISSFETGMMQMANWKGTWISDRNSTQFLPAPYFRKEFTASKEIKSARAYVAAAGLYELYLNGKKVGNHRLDPMYTRFDRRNLYVSYDITPLLKSGSNAVGVLLGNGWYNHQAMAVWNFDKAPWRARPAICMDIRITFIDGSEAIIATDGTWKTATGPIISNNIYTGEQYNANLAIHGWNTAGFNEAQWKSVSFRATPSQNISSQLMHPITNVERIATKTFKKFSDTCYVFDLGRTISGVTEVRLRGDSGTMVKIKHGERLSANGRVDLSNIDVYYRPLNDKDPFQTDIVILDGKKPLEFSPKFNYKGFQYVEVTSSNPLSLTKEDLNGQFMHSEVPAIGKISSSNPIIDKIWSATNNSYLSNLFGYPTDCPQREKNGWTGDAHFAIQTALYNFDGITIYEKWLADHRDEQQPNGVLPDIIPTGGWGYGTANGTDWTSTIAIIPWELYRFYGDVKPLSDNYENIKRYVNYIQSISKAGLTTFGRGDWVPVKSESSLEFTSSIYYFADATILAKAAKLLGKTSDAAYYSALAQTIKSAINTKYFDAKTGIYNKGVQTELSMPLLWEIVPEASKKLVALNLAKRVEKDDMHLDVGVLGARAILDALSNNGQAEIAYKLAVQDTYPSWGWWIKNGATTLYENWDINAPRDISQNHMMFGDIGGWFFRGLGGINPDENKPGFKHILLRPNFVAGLDRFKAEFQAPYGLIQSSWERAGKSLHYHVKIPANSSASLTLDLPVGAKVSLDEKLVAKQLSLNAGAYEFKITYD
jgi:alpha-L-rhamnosidase